MGTLNPYRAPFLDVNWIINTANTIGVNHFQLKLIQKMFEMFVLLINKGNPHSFCFVTCFLFIFIRETLPRRGCSTSSSVLHIWEFSMGICRGYFPREFAVGICRRNLPWELAVAIYRGFFVYICESFFVYMSKSCLYGDKPFVYVCKTFWFMRFSLLTVFLLVIVVVVMGHHTFKACVALFS